MEKVIVETISDLSGETGAHTVDLAWDGKSLQIDLTEAEHQEFSKLFSQLIEKARPVKRTAGRPKGSTATVSTGGGSGLTKEERIEVRAYAASHGRQLSERGRLPELAIMAWRSRANQAESQALLSKLAS